MQDGKHVILCIDDDGDILESLKMILEAKGYLTACAGSAEEGLRAFRKVNPDLVIVDLMMEEVDSGTSFVREVKAAGGNVPIYMLSSVGDSMNLNTDYAELGLDGVLQKPVNPDVMLKLISAKLK